jgi:hypothetical protein
MLARLSKRDSLTTAANVFRALKTATFIQDPLAARSEAYFPNPGLVSM